MHGVEDLGLLKMDFLGLRNLPVIEMALDLIEQTTGSRPDIDSVPLDDEPTFEMLRRGDSIGVFQLEGTAMRSTLRSLAPTSFDDVAALVALYRPGRWRPTCTVTTPTSRTAASPSPTCTRMWRRSSGTPTA